MRPRRGNRGRSHEGIAGEDPRGRVEQIASYHEMGFTQVALRLFYPDMPQKDVMEHIELVGREVVPAVHKL